MNKHIYITFLIVVLGLCSCSTQKNTGATRFYHRTTTKYNIYFNGNTAYADGLKQIAEAHDDNYGEILPLYPVSDHNAAESATSKMDLTIEKCRKCIKLHSIKTKPKSDPKKSKDPKYKAWLKQGEFNSELSKAWLLLGKAEFHKGDFLGAVGTFNYIARHYDYDPDIVAQCQLWTARAYAEMGWLYEAEDLANKVQADNLKRKNASLYAATMADIKLKSGQYKEAIPFVKLATPDEQRKGNRARFEYVLGQLYELDGKNQDAYQAYQRCTRLYPPVEMDFNARIRMALVADDKKNSVRQLQRLANNYKYHEQLDVIYGAIADIYLAQKDTSKALEYYNLGIEKSERNGTDKAAVLLKAGDIYYARRDYVHAAPCYTEAITILPSESDNYKRIRQRAEVLDELSAEYSTVLLQDSLQHLSTLTEAEQYQIAEQIIADLRRAEAEDSAKAAQQERDERDGGLQSVNTSKLIGGNGQTGEWYFYNAQLIRNGKQEFNRRWGTRTLEDNWRRRSKATTSDWAPMPTPHEEDDGSMSDNADNDSTANSTNSASMVTDIYQPEYYLQQIPRTPDELAASDTAIADALFNMIFIYQDKLQDTLQAEETFREFCRRFPQDARGAELYYMLYLNALKNDNTEAVEQYRQAITSLYPNSKQAQIVSDPAYFTNLRRMAAEQDSVYSATYDAYRKGQFATVKANTQYAEANYPLSPLMPRFLFLNAIAKARTEGQDAFVQALRNMVVRYPDSELATMSKDMLAMMGQGMESQQGGSVSSLADKREALQAEPEEADTTIQFSTDRNQSAYVLLIMPTPTNKSLSDNEIKDDMNSLLFEVALFNFTRFMIKDFDLTPLSAFAAGPTLRISGLDGLDEAEWYTGILNESEEIRALVAQKNIEVIQITEPNFDLIGNGKTLQDYKTFISNQH